MSKLVSAETAIARIPDDATLATAGFVGIGFPEALAVALENRFVASKKPTGLTLMYAAGQGDGTLSLSRKSEWDLAAADLLVQEAGGAITTRSGEALSYNRAVPEHDSVVAAGPGLYPELLRRTRSVRF